MHPLVCIWITGSIAIALMILYCGIRYECNRRRENQKAFRDHSKFIKIGSVVVAQIEYVLSYDGPKVCPMRISRSFLDGFGCWSIVCQYANEPFRTLDATFQYDSFRKQFLWESGTAFFHFPLPISE